MNERIEELAEQAWVEAIKILPDSEFEGGFTFEEIGVFEKIFYRMIVQKCLDIIEPNEDSNDEWCVTLKGAAQEIKEHFGVE